MSRASSDSLGEAVYEAVCSRVAQPLDGSIQDISAAVTGPVCRGLQPPPANAPQALLALLPLRTAFVDAVDGAIGPAHQGPLKALLGALLPLHDDHTLRRLAGAAAQALRGLARDDTVLQGLQRLAERQGYIPADVSFVSAVADGPEMAVLLPAVVAATKAHPEAWQALQAIWTASDGDTEGLLDGVLRALESLAEPLWAPRDGAAVAEQDLTLVMRDRAGRAVRSAFSGVSTQISPTPESLPSPFACAGDPESPPRGHRDIARDAMGMPLYSYRPTRNTLLAQATSFVGAALSAQARAAQGLPQGAPLQALTALSAEPSAEITALVDALAAVAQRLWPMRAKLAAVGHHLFAEHEPQVVEAARAWAAAVAAAPAQPVATSPAARDAFVVQLSAWASRLANRPELTADVLAALAQPDSALLAPELAAEMLHVDAIDFDPLNINGLVIGRLETPVNLAHPRSTFSRLLALVQGARNARLCSAALEEPMPQYDRCALFEVPCIATFYLNTLAGAAELTLNIDDDDWFFPDQFAGALEDAPNKSEMEGFTGIDGFTRVHRLGEAPGSSNALTFNVNSKAASRLLFALHDERVPQDSAFGRSRAGVQLVSPRLLTPSGAIFDQVYRGTVFAWESEGFARGVRPVVQAFVAHGAQDLLLDLLGVLHEHWPALLAEDAHFEARLAHLLGDARLVRAGSDVMQALASGPQQPWPVIAAALAAATADDGSGVSPVARLLTAHADAASSVTPGLPSVFTALLGPADGTPDNVHLRPVLRAWLGAAKNSESTGPLPNHFDPQAWLRAPAPRPLAALAVATLQTADAQQAALSLGARLFDGDTAPGLTAVADLVQLVPDAPHLASLAAACAHHLVGVGHVVPEALQVAQRLWAPGGIDEQGTALALVRRLVTVPAAKDGAPPAGSPWTTLWGIGQKLTRQEPMAPGPLQAPDIAQAFGVLANFLDDDQHGLVRLFDLIAARHGEVPRAVTAP